MLDQVERFIRLAGSRTHERERRGASVVFDRRAVRSLEIDRAFGCRDPVRLAIVATLPPGPYTAIVAGNGSATGVGLVELYLLKQ